MKKSQKRRKVAGVEVLKKLEACPNALTWARGHGGTLAELWRDCPRGDWLLWYAAEVGGRREDLVRAAAGCAELALPYARAERGVCEAAIAAARAWADAPGVETANAAYVSANAAYTAKAANAATYATYAAANAAKVADAAANAAANVAYTAANAAANAAGVAAGVAANTAMRRKCADVVRKHIKFKAVK